MDAGAATETARGSSPTRSAQEVLRRMSLNSPPSRTDNPRQVKRAKVLGGEGGGAAASRPFAVPQAVQTPATVRKPPPPSSRAAGLDGPSPMPSWGVNLRDASAGEPLEAGDHDPSSYYPSFQLDCLRQPYGSGASDGAVESAAMASPAGGGGGAGASPTSTAMDDDDDHSSGGGGSSGGGSRRATPGGGVSLRSMGGGDEDDAFPPPPSPARLEMVGGGSKSSRGLGGIAAALEQARNVGGAGAGVPETPLRRPGSGVRSRAPERGAAARGGGDSSCSPVGGYAGFDSSAVQGSPVKKRSVGRWRMSEEGRRETSAEQGRAACEESPLRSNRNPFSPDRDEDFAQGDAMSMPAPAPRSRLSCGGAVTGGADGSPMDTGDFDAMTAGIGRGAGKGDEGRQGFLRRVSVGSTCSSSSAPTTAGKKTVQDVTNPSPCDVAAFVPVTPCRGKNSAEAMRLGGDTAPMSPVSSAGGGVNVSLNVGNGEKAARGRFATDFEVKEIIGAGGFGTVYKVRSRVDGCLYAVKCSRRRFKGETDRQNMLMEVYALAAVCDSAQETINIVRYHQAWIEEERLYIQTELCETSLEKQLESGHRLEISGVYAFLRQTLLGLEILHQHKLVHLDIKPGNIFVKNGQYKLGDFGLVTPVHVRSGTDVVEGDSRYMSKELLNDDHSNLTKCDVFSLGITLYEIISGRPLPPNGEEWHRLRSGKAGMPMGLPAELSKTLHEMMDPDPARRPSAAELLRYPCLQSEMERQLNDQKSELSKERTRNSGLLEEVSALIQKQSQRSGRLSRTITWDNSYFAANGAKGKSPSRNLSSKPSLGGTPDAAARGGREAVRSNLSAFNASNPSGVFGGGESAPALFGPGVVPRPSTAVGSARGAGAGAAEVGRGVVALSRVEEEGSDSPSASGDMAGGASLPASFERLRQA
ncbi:unnamed protein product [Ectocarpus sp. 12 AP-2014]